MKKKIDLVAGNIFKTLLKLSLPILGTSFIQMAYNMVDMIWIGRIGSGAVAAVGTAGFFTWFGSSFVLISKIGAEVGVSQSIGKHNEEDKNRYIYNSILMAIILALIYTFILILFQNPLIGFFNLGNLEIISMAKKYLIIVAIGMIFLFLNPQFTGILTATGNSKTPFIANTIGLLINILLDPLLIFGFKKLPALGVAGAALATVFSQMIVTVIFIVVFIKNGYKFNLDCTHYINLKFIKNINAWGSPIALQNCLFSIFAMVIARIVATWGPVPIAVQKVGSQIESISWMTAGGFSSALTAFVGQNYGAGKFKRVNRGYITTIVIASLLGIFATVLLIFKGEIVFSIFIPDKDILSQGADYLRILGYSQLFMCIEITTAGAFFGLGRTTIPSVVSIVFTGLRIPLAIVLSKPELLGINGVWWAISLTSVVKGILLVVLYIVYVMNPMKKEIELSKPVNL